MDGASIAVIRRFLEPGFETHLFEAVLKNLEADNALRFNNFAYSARETVRHIFKRLAPDKAVLACAWYKNETEKPDGISRRQRARYAVQGGLSDLYVKETLGLDSDGDHKALSAALEGLNKYTHVEPETFGMSDQEVRRRGSETLAAVAKVLETVKECRDRIIRTLGEEIDAAAIDEVLSDPLTGVIDLASHFSVEDVSVGAVKVTDIDQYLIHIRVEGTVDCILQFGSNSDVRRGDGAEVPQSFAFACMMCSPVADPKDLSLVEDSIGVDTEEWQRMRYGADEND